MALRRSLFILVNMYTLNAILSCVVLQENVSVVVSRQLVTDVATSLSKFDPETCKEMSTYTLNCLQTRAISFEEQVLYLLK